MRATSLKMLGRSAAWQANKSSRVMQRAMSTSREAASTPLATPEFAIVGQSRPGRAIYLDSQASAPASLSLGLLSGLPRPYTVNNPSSRASLSLSLLAFSRLRQATTPLDPRALDAMLPYLTGMYGNAHSVTHAYGWESAEVVDTAREQVASLVSADPKEIIFTSGATESNNMAIKGVAGFYAPKKRHVITTVTEHKCVLDSCRSLQQQGFEVTYLPVKQDGLIDLQQLSEAIRPETALVSCMMVNNEIGVIQPIGEIGKMCRERGVFFHVDAAQAVGKIPVDVNELKIDLMSMSAHKLYGPKGIGALYVRRRPRVRLEPVFSGGGQERGFRSGTLPHPLVAGFGAACEIAGREMERDTAHVTRLHKRLYDGCVAAIPHVEVNGSVEHRYPGNLNISFA